MSRKRILLAFLLGALLAGAARDAAAGAKCGGKFFNPVSDVDWRAMFPIKIRGNKGNPRGGDRHGKPFSALLLRIPGPPRRDKGFVLGTGEAC